MKYLLLACICAVVASCGTPVRFGVDSDYGRLEYSPKGGLGFYPDLDRIVSEVNNTK